MKCLIQFQPFFFLAVRGLSYGTWDLKLQHVGSSSLIRIWTRAPALGTLNLSHWTSREGPPGHFSLPLPTTDEYLVWKAIWALKILQTTEFYHYKNIWSLTIWKICQRQRWIFYLCITRHLFACQCDFTRHLMDWDHCFPKCDV